MISTWVKNLCSGVNSAREKEVLHKLRLNLIIDLGMILDAANIPTHNRYAIVPDPESETEFATEWAAIDPIQRSQDEYSTWDANAQET